MRKRRLKAPASWDRAFYHCISRVVDRQFVFGDEEHAEFIRFMRVYEKLCQVKVLTYCLMSNHFHLLVEVPARPPEAMTEEALCEHVRTSLGQSKADHLRWQLDQCHLRQDEAGAQKLMESWFCRMWDISAFMKLLKQCFTQWFNLRHKRYGTLWETRFKSCLVEDGTALLLVATYIDLNPVRAKMVQDPKDYRWCGYAAAMRGGNLAYRGLRRIVQLSTGAASAKVRGAEALAEYRCFLYLAGESSPAHKRAGFQSEEVQAVLGQRGKLSRAELLQFRVRYFIDGEVLGSKAFVDQVFESCRERYSPKRKTGARPMKGADFDNLCTLRNLRVGVIS